MAKTKQAARKRTRGLAPRLGTISHNGSGHSSSSSIASSPIQFLDLSDEILELIGQYIDNDINIPIPSYGPPWENYKSELGPENSKNLREFRATCSRIRSVCKLQGSHLELRNLDYTKRPGGIEIAPQEFKKSVSRIRVNTKESCTTEYRFESILTSLPSLTELIIEGSTGCRLGRSHFLATFPLPASDNPGTRQAELPNLLSLSINISCKECLNGLMSMLVPLAPNLQHLRYNLMIPEDQNEVDDIVISILKKPFETLCGKNSTLKTLYLKYPEYPSGTSGRLDAVIQEAWTDVVHTIFELFPILESLSVVQTRELSKVFSRFYIKVSARSYGSSQSNTGQDDANVTICDLLNKSATGTCSLAEFVEKISPPETLKYFDPFFTVDGSSIAPSTLPPKISDNRSLYRNRHDQQIRTANRDSGDYERRLRGRMMIVIENLLTLIPSLEGGAFWKKGTMESEQNWYRWEWRKLNDGKNLAYIELDLTPWIYTSDFLRKRDRFD